MKKIAFIISCIILAVNCDAQEYQRFINKFIRRYEKDASARPTDTLLYVAGVYNLCGKNSKYYKLSIAEQRRQLFDCLLQKRMNLVYPMAVSKSYSIYYNPVGDMDYGPVRKHKIKLIKERFIEGTSQKYIDECNALMDYVSKHDIDYIFTIFDIIDIVDGAEIYWIISNNTIYVIRYDVTKKVFNKYDVDDYLLNIADDSVFDVGLRLAL